MHLKFTSIGFKSFEDIFCEPSKIIEMLDIFSEEVRSCNITTKKKGLPGSRSEGCEKTRGSGVKRRGKGT